jgi:hypothetical protein
VLHQIKIPVYGLQKYGIYFKDVFFADTKYQFSIDKININILYRNLII